MDGSDSHAQPTSAIRNTRSRRRKLACVACHRLKTRCDYDPVSQSCRRCVNLRLKCSIHPSQHNGRAVHVSDQGTDRNRFSRDDTVSNSVTLLDLRDSVDALRRDVRAHICHPKGNSLPLSGDTVSRSTVTATCEDGSTGGSTNLVDKRSTSAPVSIIRQVNAIIDSNQRRNFCDQSADVVNAGLLSAADATQLFQAFCQQYQDLLHMPGAAAPAISMTIQSQSPFLFAVCCLNGIRLCPWLSLEGSKAHQSLWAHVETTLREVLTLSPIPINSIYGIMLMSTVALTLKFNKNYIDSWLLSGYCAQQAMLAINFTAIRKKIAQSSASGDDLRQLRLWSAVCLNHLHFSVGCGRPSVIASVYFDQTQLLLKSNDWTTHDEVVIAEIMLYRYLHENLDEKIIIGEDGLCERLEAWKSDWDHLLDIPNRQPLRLSYHFVYVVVLKQQIELLREESSEGASTNSSQTSEDQEQFLIWLAYLHARSVLEFAMAVPASSVAGTSTYEYMNLAYCALALSDYINERDVPSDEMLVLLEKVQNYYDYQTGKSQSALQFAVSKAKSARQQEREAGLDAAPMGLDATGQNTDDRGALVNQDYLTLEDLNMFFPNFGGLFTNMNTGAEY